MKNADIKGFISFSRLPKNEQCKEIETNALLVDIELGSEKMVKLYFLNGFFVEQEIDENGQVLENIPFRQGYKLSLFRDHNDSSHSLN
jgi:hypothetical protein